MKSSRGRLLKNGRKFIWFHLASDFELVKNVYENVFFGKGSEEVAIPRKGEITRITEKREKGIFTLFDEAGIVAKTIKVGNHPLSVSVDPTTNRIYVANRDSNDVSVIDGENNTVVIRRE